jgi:hypothetical protein
MVGARQPSGLGCRPQRALRPPLACRVRKDQAVEAAMADFKMVGNIAREMTRPPSLSVLERRGPTSLNADRRRREMRRIDQENERLLKRLESARPAYRKMDQQRSYVASRGHAALASAGRAGANGSPDRCHSLPPRPWAQERNSPHHVQGLSVLPPEGAHNAAGDVLQEAVWQGSDEGLGSLQRRPPARVVKKAGVPGLQRQSSPAAKNRDPKPLRTPDTGSPLPQSRLPPQSQPLRMQRMRSPPPGGLLPTPPNRNRVPHHLRAACYQLRARRPRSNLRVPLGSLPLSSIQPFALS